MKRLTLLATGLAAAIICQSASAQPVMPQSIADYPGAAGVKRYHAAVLDALSLEHKRFDWCMPRMSEASNYPVPASCYAIPSDMNIEAVEGLERKVAPKAWVAFDNQMAKYSN